MRQWQIVAAILVGSSSILWLHYGAQQSEFLGIFIAFASAFGCYLWILRQQWSPRALRFWQWGAVLLACAMLFGTPKLSDDVYRFLWDGNLTLAGENPFHTRPSFWKELKFPLSQARPQADGPIGLGINEQLYLALNSPDYYTIYPPLPQGINALSVGIGSTITQQMMWLRLFAILAFIGSIVVLRKLLEHTEKPAQHLLFWALNPLVLVEGVSNLHHELFMCVGVGVLLLGWYEKKGWRMGLGAAIAVLAKLLPLLFAPFFLLKTPQQLRWSALAAFLLVVVSGWWWFVDLVFVENILNSVDLYFRRFEFNASVYYFVNGISSWWKGYNNIGVVGPALAVISAMSILFISWLSWRHRWRVPTALLFIFSTYLFFATTVHPWYVLMPVFLAPLTKFRFPLIWSALIVLTYINYSYSPYWENLWLVAAEYAIVLVWIGKEIRENLELFLPERCI